ncbi:putative tRNA pseudouridine synthase Pus10 [Anopheles cruzii]|uniref:putative tRNA pseudouridine synthase Pus10 n=1 Tax=Anopheles cruzii TaxID=68878 RepID=UPI0022EC7647|nr:putative tRNA pseudouridine synthase Pus10 [Anopheles cruzii]
MDQQKTIFNYLRSVDCCRVCCLRHLKATKEDFLDVNAALAKRNLEPQETTTDEPRVKKAKPNLCITCLGLFESLDSLVAEVKQSEAFHRFRVEAGFLISISLPIVLQLRQLALWFDLYARFPDTFRKDTPPDFAIKDALKIIIIDQLERTLGRPFSVDGVMITVPYSYELEQKELATLELIQPEVFAKRKRHKHCKRDFITRNAFEKFFHPDVIDGELFGNHYPVPPVVVQNEGLVRGPVSFTGPTIFLAGRYNKVSRELSQTPWIIDGKRMMEGSVQETIGAPIAPHFGVPLEQLIFSASGREDVDVRCLGEGRPFVMEIPNAVCDQLPEDVAVAMERSVDESKNVSIKDLQLVKREDLGHIRGTELDKRKFYSALCVTAEPVTKEMISKLRTAEPFVIEQVTPLRVLHRRPLLKRQRTIYSMRAQACRDNPHAMVIDIVTEAGTYIKELVHGDFGRTQPNLCKMIGMPIDIQALDVMAIDLDWPKRLRR